MCTVLARILDSYWSGHAETCRRTSLDRPGTIRRDLNVTLCLLVIIRKAPVDVVIRMPPRKGTGRGIVKSGNAGNAKPSPHVPVPVKTEQDKPLFPFGSKFPLSLLNER
jgi:hypothetical protein